MNRPEDPDRDVQYREFVRLLGRHERQLMGYVHTLVPSWQDAEDILQETRLRLWEQFDAFRPAGDFSAWAIAIANFMVKAHRKRCLRQRVCFSDDLLQKISQHVPALSASHHDDRMAALLECVRRLGDSSRALLRAFCSGQQQIKELAGEFGQTPSAIYSALFRIRRSLFDCVKERLREEDGQ